MRTLTVALPGRNYEIQIQRGLLAQAGQLCRQTLPQAGRLFVITDSVAGPLFQERLRASLASAGFQVALRVIPAGEQSKCAAQLAQLW